MITGVAFYADVESAMWDDASFEVKIAEVDSTSLINSVMPHLGAISVNAKLTKKIDFFFETVVFSPQHSTNTT